jgi:hypothetical protein
LWVYIPAETKKVPVPLNTNQGVKNINTQQLGDVGGRIVAETFVGLLLSDESSYFNQTPSGNQARPTPKGDLD